MDMEELQERYMDAVLDRITSCRYPSKEMMDRVENVAVTREQAERFVMYLIATVQGVKYPSHELMDRAERILFGIAARH